MADAPVNLVTPLAPVGEVERRYARLPIWMTVVFLVFVGILAAGMATN